MTIVIALDSFKGCLSSAEANRAAAEGALEAYPDARVVQMPVSDGGEGWLEAFHDAIGGRLIDVMVSNPMMNNIASQYLLKDDLAVIEMAKASGLTLVAPENRNPLVATSYGTGQLVSDAIQRGCRRIIIGLGGSATSDCGKGMLRAITDALAPHGGWDDVKPQLDHIAFTIATDVRNPLYGEHGAAQVFAPQKGATPAMVATLDEQARRFAADAAHRCGYDRSQEEGAGAAGGLGYAFMQFMGAECKSGADLLLDTIGFNHILTNADLIITGEGMADSQTLMGKLPFNIMKRGAAIGVPTWLIAGRVTDTQSLISAGFAAVRCIHPDGLPMDIAMQRETAKENIRQTCHTLGRESLLNHSRFRQYKR